MRRRFWVSVALTIPLVAVAMGEHLPGHPLARIATMSTLGWLQLVLATPVVLWGGWPFFVRGWQSVVHRSLNMFTLIGLGVGVSYLYSLVAKLFPGIFPPSFRMEGGEVAVYFEAAAAIVTLVLLGQVLELKARSRTGAAVKALLGLAPKTARRLSRATMRNIKQNLFFAFVYNALGVPVAAGVLYPFTGILLSPVIAAAAMSFSSVSVVGNALRLRRAEM